MLHHFRNVMARPDFHSKPSSPVRAVLNLSTDDPDVSVSIRFIGKQVRAHVRWQATCCTTQQHIDSLIKCYYSPERGQKGLKSKGKYYFRKLRVAGPGALPTSGQQYREYQQKIKSFLLSVFLRAHFGISLFGGEILFPSFLWLLTYFLSLTT